MKLNRLHIDFAKQLLVAPYYDLRTVSSGSDGPFTEMGVARNLLQRVGGRAGTAAPQGAVCELPNPLDLSTSFSNRLEPRKITKYR